MDLYGTCAYLSSLLSFPTSRLICFLLTYFWRHLTCTESPSCTTMSTPLSLLAAFIPFTPLDVNITLSPEHWISGQIVQRSWLIMRSTLSTEQSRTLQRIVNTSHHLADIETHGEKSIESRNPYNLIQKIAVSQVKIWVRYQANQQSTLKVVGP